MPLQQEMMMTVKQMMEEVNLPAGVSMNPALSENLFMMVLAVAIRAKLFVVGVPGLPGFFGTDVERPNIFRIIFGLLRWASFLVFPRLGNPLLETFHTSLALCRELSTVPRLPASFGAFTCLLATPCHSLVLRATSVQLR